MASSEILSTYIKKLSHPLKEIRERSLQLLLAKLRLGWQLEDELSNTRELLEALLAWFYVQQPSLQREALELLLTTIRTKAGTYIAREFGTKKIILSLNRIKPKIEPSATEVYQDVMDTLRFLHVVQSEENVTVPPLALHSLASSESDGGSSDGYYTLGHNVQSSETSTSNEEIKENRYSVEEATNGIKVMLFPWVELCSSDSKTILLVEDALKLLKSARRCCRFIRDVFLRDFPPEIFLNRPAIIKSLLAISDAGHGARPAEALHVLLCITRTLRTRLFQLSSLDLINETNKMTEEHKDSVDRVNLELEQITGEGLQELSQRNDALAAVRQLPAPIYALDTLHAILSTMARSIVLVDAVDKNEVLDLKETNTCLCLIECLVQLLLDCVSERFWCIEHSSKTHRDIAHKSCMNMRLLGDLLMKYRKSFLEDTERCHHRMAWLRLVPCAERLLRWARESALPPSMLVVALQAAQLDPALELLYPELSKRIATTLQSSRISVDQEYKSKYRELTKLSASMVEAASFMKNRNSCRNSKQVLSCLKTSLPTLELHQSEAYFNDMATILLKELKDLDLNDNDWSNCRSVALSLMAHNMEWVQVKFYDMMAKTVKSVLVSEEINQVDNEKSLVLLCDVSMLTEICCHGLPSKVPEIESSASEIMLYLLRGRMVLSESCWWRLLACLLPVLPLLHVYAAHDTQLGKAICKSFECDIAECMGVSLTEVTSGLVRLLFVRCPSVQMDAALSLCHLLDDQRYLPPRETLRTDVLISALRRVQPEDFNVDYSSSPSKTPQTTGLLQILEVLKQDIVLDEHGAEFVTRSTLPTLEPSLRRSTLQQLSVMMRQQEMHDTFIQYDGLKIIVGLLRMSMMVDDYLAFPECAISCVSVLNSVCFLSRHSLAKIPDILPLLIRVILVFPANDSAVLMSAQILALVAWSGFALQELDATHRRVPALPMSVTQRTSLPFVVNSYWNTSPNAQHSSIEWLLSDEDWRAAIRVRWWCAFESGPRVLLGAPPPPAPPGLRPTAPDLASLRAACPSYSCTRALLHLENATSHKQVTEALSMLESYIHLLPSSSVDSRQFGALPWQHTRRFLCAPPASSRDAALLVALLQFILAYMDNVPNDSAAMSWIKSTFIGNDGSVISLLSRHELYPEQSVQESIEVTQLHIYIVKVLLRCVVQLEGHDDYNSNKMQILVKILLVCLERIDLKNFHMLGYLNELVRCIRYALSSRYCKLSEDTVVVCLKLMTSTLSGCASGGGRKGQACRLDAMLALLALLRQIHEEEIPAHRWSEAWSGDVLRAVVNCSWSGRAELRAVALHIIAALAHHSQLMPQLLQAVPDQSLPGYAAGVFSESREANVVRTAAAALLTAVTARVSPHSDGDSKSRSLQLVSAKLKSTKKVILQCDILEQLQEQHFTENCLEILVDFCNETEYKNCFEPNIPLAMLERRSELEVRAEKTGDVCISPSLVTFRGRAPPAASLVAALADVLYNVSVFPRCPVQAWNERGLYRLLFRCASWSKGSRCKARRVRAATCRALFAIASSQKCVRATLAATKDCLHNLLVTLKPLDEGKSLLHLCCFQLDGMDADSLSARTQSLLLLASLLVEQSASDTVWGALRDRLSKPFFQSLLQGSDSDDTALQNASLYCLTQLAQSATHKKHPDKTRDTSRIEFFDNLKSYQGSQSDRYGGGDIGRNDCQPQYMAEELCKMLVDLHQKLSSDGKCLTAQDEQWSRVCSCLSSVLSISPRSRLYGVHRQLPRLVLVTLQAARDRLALQGSVDGIRNAAQNPVLRTLYWLLTIINCLMVDCEPAKDCFAEDNLVVSLNRLWPWFMLTEQLRDAVMHLLLTFSNDCAKAWSTMSMCVGGRSLVVEVCALTSREAGLQSRPRPDTLLLLCLRTLRHAASHHHCRAIILKSEVLSCMYKLRVRERGHSPAGVEWARLCEALARHEDGAGALLALRPLLAAPPVRARLLPALAHSARHRRAAMLQATDILELLSGTLLAGDTAEIVSAARAVWTLAANNHKAKLLLRSAGVSAAVQSALQRMQRAPGDPDTRRALQLLIYTNNVLQTS